MTQEELRNIIQTNLKEQVQPLVVGTLSSVASAIQDAYMKGFETGYELGLNHEKDSTYA